MEKYCEKNKYVYLAFLDLEKAYYRVDRRTMWRVLQMYAGDGVHGRAAKSFCGKSKARGGREFRWTVGFRQGCDVAMAV